MRYIFIIFISFLFIGCDETKEDVYASSLVEFNQFLGKEKGKCLDDMVLSFENFLETNFPEKQSNSERAEAYLKYLTENDFIDSTWVFETQKNKKILKRYEKSGLRKDIWTRGSDSSSTNFHVFKKDNKWEVDSAEYGYVVLELEEEELMPVKGETEQDIQKRKQRIDEFEKREMEKYLSWLRFNFTGKFLYGFSKFGTKDSAVDIYVSTRSRPENNFISYYFANELIEFKTNFDNPFIKRMLVAEFYIDMMQWDIERKEKPLE